jgi:hypothetical protein
MFTFGLVEDRLPNRIRDGVRYVAEKRHGKKIREGILKKRAADKDKDEAVRAAKKAKATYMVDPKKFASTATEDELAQELTEEDLGTEDIHRILQCKIR